MRCGPTLKKKHVLRTTVLAALLLSFSALGASAQTAESYRQQATEQARAKSWDDAIANYRKAIALESNSAVTHYDLAFALKYKGETTESLKEFEEAAQLRPKWADAHYALGAAWYDMQDSAAALKELQTAETLDPSNAATHRLLGRILSQQDNLVDAEHEFKVAVRLKPSADTHLELGGR